MSEQKEQNVGASLMSALFEKVGPEEASEPEAPEASQEPEVSQEPEAKEESDEINVYGLSDAIDIASSSANEEQIPVEEDTAEPVEEEKEEPLSKLDKSLFKDVEPVAQKEEIKEEKPEPSEKKPEDENLSWLTPDQRKRLELVEFAENNFDDYKGKRDEYIQFFKDQKEYLDVRLQEDPDAALDDTDHDYQNFLKRKKPKFSQDDLERVVELRTRKLAKEEAMAELKPELEAIKAEQKRAEVKPVVDSLKDKTMSQIKDMIPDFIKEVIDTDGPQAAYEANPVEYELVDRIVTMHQKTMFAFHEISNGLTDYDPSNKDHVRLAGFIDQLESSMPDRDGKKFVNIVDYQSMPAKEKSKAYTLSHEEIVEYANNSAKKYIAQELNAFEAKLRKSGYTRAGRAIQQENTYQAPKPVKPQPRQGPSVAKPQTEASSPKNPVLSALGF